MLSPTDVASLTITIAIILAGLVIMLLAFANMEQKKFKSVIGWITFTNVALLIWAVFHVFLDIALFPADIVDLLHYWVAHSFIVIAAIGLIIVTKMVVKASKQKK
jgi:hypothetical protein